MFALYLNPVTANAERYVPVAVADSYEKLEQLLESESCDGFYDGSFFRSFRQGPLWNFNPPQINGENVFGSLEGIVEVVSREDLIEFHQQQLQEWDAHFLGCVVV